MSNSYKTSYITVNNNCASKIGIKVEEYILISLIEIIFQLLGINGRSARLKIVARLLSLHQGNTEMRNQVNFAKSTLNSEMNL